MRIPSFLSLCNAILSEDDSIHPSPELARLNIGHLSVQGDIVMTPYGSARLLAKSMRYRWCLLSTEALPPRERNPRVLIDCNVRVFCANTLSKIQRTPMILEPRHGIAGTGWGLVFR